MLVFCCLKPPRVRDRSSKETFPRGVSRSGSNRRQAIRLLLPSSSLQGVMYENLGDLCAESGQTLQGSFSAVSKPKFASNYRSFRLYRSQNLQVSTRWEALAEIYTMHSFAPFFNPKISAKNRRHFFAIELMNIH